MEEMKEITTEQLEEALKNGANFTLVDVREDIEVAEGMIPEAEHIRMNDIPNRLDFFSKEKEYVFICRAGVRSENVCYYLQDKGYNVINMVGGMLNWHGPVVKKG